MLDFIELEQFVAFAECGTLSKAAERLHISQPTLTRAMRQVEEAFGVTLFVRGKNRIALNQTGEKAVEYARKLLAEEKNAVQMVQDFDRNLHTITVASCAPAPLWSLLPALSARYPENAIASRLCSIPDIIQQVEHGVSDYGILPFAYTSEKISDYHYISEKLSVCVPATHALAAYEEVSFGQINGFNCLLRDKIGFWTELCQENMPASKFLVQTDEFALEELIRTSTLLCFITNLATIKKDIFHDRKSIPIIDASADVTYHIICRNNRKPDFVNV